MGREVGLFLLTSIALFMVQTCNTRPYNEETHLFYDELKEFIKHLSNEKKSYQGESGSSNEKTNKVQDLLKVIGKGGIKRKTFTKEEIDNKNVDVNSPLEIILEGMVDNGKKPDGIHPSSKGNIKAFKLEENHHRHNQHQHSRRNFVPQLQVFDKYWPNATIPYVISLDAFDNKRYVKRMIKEAKDEFEEKTCVKLVEKNKDEITEAELTYYINITNKDDGCYSDVGRLYNSDSEVKGQILNLKEDGCLYKSTVIHEFCHALGMEHEQSRADRDDHVIVHFENIDEENKYNLEKQTTLDKNPYDYFSVMQYELTSFTNKNWKNGMSFRDPDLEFLAGLAPGLSFYDVMDITKAYKCNEECEIDLPCINGGFMNHKCECFCPEGLTGKYCDVIASGNCGGIIELKPGQAVNITSPNYPSNYDVGEICYWLLRAENSDQRIMIEVNDFHLPSNKKLSRCYHWLEIRYNLVAQPGTKYCDDKFGRNKISTTEYGNPDLMMIIFDSATVTGADASKGFHIKAEAFEVSSKQCNNNPPVVENASNNFDTVGSSVGSIVIYTCEYYHQMVGQNSITCEADGTWSNVRFECVEMDPIFECDFERNMCGIKRNDDGGHNWKIKREKGNKYFAVTPLTSSSSTWARFTIPKYIQVDNVYCLSFYFRRSSDSEHCADFYVGDVHYYRWTYYECKEVEWTLFQGNYGPFDDVDEKKLKVDFTAEVESSDGGEYNIDIDDIIISEGSC